MHQGTGHAIWNYARRGTLTVALLLAGTSLSGCILEIPTPTLDMDAARGLDRMPRDETGPWTYRDPTEKELLLARSDFSIEIVRFTDARYPRSMEVESPDQLIYNYDPDTLMGSVNHQVPAMMGKYLSYRPKVPKHYKVEIELKKMITNIETGTFWSGSWGRYHVTLELQSIVRRPDSTVALMKTFRIDEHQPRESYNGRGPSKERDRARMFDLVESSMRKMAEDIGWNVRQRDARNWTNVPQPKTINQRLNLPPVDRASGSTESDAAPMRVVPSKPVDNGSEGMAPDENGGEPVREDYVAPAGLVI